MLDRLLKLLRLQFYLLAGRGDGYQPPAHLSELVEHLLVGQVEHLVGLLGRVEGLVGLGLQYVVRPLEETHTRSLLVDGGVGPAPMSLPGAGSGPVPPNGTTTPEAT